MSALFTVSGLQIVPKKYRRREGDRILYTPNQTQRYQSQWTRYEKGLVLAESNKILEVEPDVYRVPSKRSPIGYWEIKAGGMSGGSVIYQSYGLSNGNADGLVTGQLFAGYGDNNVPSNIGVDPTLTYDFLYSQLILDGTELFEYTNGIDGNTAGVAYDYYVKIDRSANRNRITAYYEDNDPSSSIIEGTHLLVFTFFAPLDYSEPTEAIFQVTFIPPSPTPPQYFVDIPINPVVLTFPQTNNDFKYQNVIFQLGYFTPSTPGFYQNGMSVELTSLTGQTQVGYECTCPDYSKFEDAFVPPKFKSLSSPRDWLASEAGAPTWADGQRRCYHIVGVQQVRGEEIPVPLDFPLGEA